MSFEVVILGSGSSGGVPRGDGDWGDCDPANPRNRRRRCALLLEREGPQGTTRVLIDTSPDLREQMLSAGVRHIDGVLYTHDHADQTHGIDDLRQLAYNMDRRIPVHADAQTSAQLLDRFGYVFHTPEGSSYPPICTLLPIEGAFAVEGAGGPLRLLAWSGVTQGGWVAVAAAVSGAQSAAGYLAVYAVAALTDPDDIPAATAPLLEQWQHTHPTHPRRLFHA